MATWLSFWILSTMRLYWCCPLIAVPPGRKTKVTQVHLMESLLETAHCNARKVYDKYREQSFKVERTDPSDICTFKFVNALFTEVKATSDTCIFFV